MRKVILMNTKFMNGGDKIDKPSNGYHVYSDYEEAAGALYDEYGEWYKLFKSAYGEDNMEVPVEESEHWKISTKDGKNFAESELYVVPID